MAGCMTQYCVDTSVRRTVSLGYDVTLAEDGHLKQTPSLLRSIRSLLITTLLDGFDALKHSVRVEPFKRILW